MITPMASHLDALGAVTAQFAAVVLKACGARVEITVRSESSYTVSGETAQVDTAMTFLTTNELMIEESRTFDEEIGETFCYTKCGSRMQWIRIL